MDYYYYDQLGDNELDDNEDYDYDAMPLSPDELFKDVYEGCMQSSTQQVQRYILVLLGCACLHRISWETLKRLLGNNRNHQYLYHLSSLIWGLMGLWFYVGTKGSFYVGLHVLNLCAILKLTLLMKINRIGTVLCTYTIAWQLLFEYFLKSEQYEIIRGPQMVVSMKLISLAFEIQNEKLKYHLLSCIGYLANPASLILGPWVSLKDYKPDSNAKVNIMSVTVRIVFYAFLAVIFLNLSNCLLPWLKQLMGPDLWWAIYLDAFSVRCSHYFVCYLSQATLLTAMSGNCCNAFMSFQSIVNPLAIEFPRSLSQVIRSWNIPMHLWLKQNIFNSLRASKYSYFMAIVLTYSVSCLVHGFNYKVHSVLISLGFFSYFENVLRRCLAQVFDACIEASLCKHNCKYKLCPRRSHGGYFSTPILLVRLVNFIFSVLVILQLAYLGVMLNADVLSNSKSLHVMLLVWSNMNYFGHILALLMFAFYKCI